jgi:inosine/xanthosine triphosphate pyrophosphatase family protein
MATTKRGGVQAMTRIITLDSEAAALSDGALALIEALKTFENDVLSKAGDELTERQNLVSIANDTKLCRQKLESLRERLMLAAAKEGESAD